MRAPHVILRETITIQDFAGSGARGPIYAASRSARASVQPTSKLASDAHGNQVAVDALAIVRPEAGPIPIESIVTWLGQRYRVAQAFPMPDSRRPSHWELSLTKYAS